MTKFNLNFLKFQKLDSVTGPILFVPQILEKYLSLQGPFCASEDWGPLGGVLTPTYVGCATADRPQNVPELPTNDDQLPTSDDHKASSFQQAIELPMVTAKVEV